MQRIIVIGVLGTAVLAQNPSLQDILKNGVKRGGQSTQQAPPPKAESPKADAPEKVVAPPPAAPRNDATARTAAAPSGGQSSGAGYRLNLPQGWRSELTQSQAVVARSADGSALVVIAPIMAPASVSAQEYLARYVARGIGGWFPNAAVTNVVPSRLGRAGALAALQYRTPSGPGRASALLFMSGGVGTLYMIGAPAAAFTQAQPALIGILRSFSFDGQPASGRSNNGGVAAAAPQLSYTKFTDPYEGSFSCDVPAGWNVKGGLIRKTTVDVRTFLRLNSPNGVSVFVGDPEIGTFVTPNQTMSFGGFREGSPYSPGYGSAMTVRSYVPGLQFAQEYLRRVAASAGITDIRPKDMRQRPDLSGQENGIAQQAWTAGEVSFEGMRQGQPVAGYVLAGTKITAMSGTGMWNVITLLGYVAPVDQVATPTAVIQRIMQTIRVDPRWFGQQQQTTANTSAIVTDTNARVSQIITDSYWSRQRVQDRTNQNFSDHIRGIVRLRDPDSGEELEGTAGKNYYWRVRGTNTIIGSDQPSPPPTIDVTELEQVR